MFWIIKFSHMIFAQQTKINVKKTSKLNFKKTKIQLIQEIFSN